MGSGGSLLLINFFFGWFAGIGCESIAAVTGEYQPKVNLLVGDVKIALGESGSEVGATRSTISRNIYWQKDSFYVKLKHSKKAVEDAIAAAEASGKNASACVDAFNVELERVNVEVIKRCHRNADVYEVQKRMDLLRELVNNAEILVDGCVAKFPSPLQVENLRHCLDLGVSVIRADVVERQRGVSSALVVALANSNECVATTSAELENAVKEVVDDFNECADLL